MTSARKWPRGRIREPAAMANSQLLEKNIAPAVQVCRDPNRRARWDQGEDDGGERCRMKRRQQRGSCIDI